MVGSKSQAIPMLINKVVRSKKNKKFGVLESKKETICT